MSVNTVFVMLLFCLSYLFSVFAAKNSSENLTGTCPKLSSTTFPSCGSLPGRNLYTKKVPSSSWPASWQITLKSTTSRASPILSGTVTLSPILYLDINALFNRHLFLEVPISSKHVLNSFFAYAHSNTAVEVVVHPAHFCSCWSDY